MRLVIDYKKCLKSGQCSYLHSELITAGADGTPRVIIEQIEEHLRDAHPIPKNSSLAPYYCFDERNYLNWRTNNLT